MRGTMQRSGVLMLVSGGLFLTAWASSAHPKVKITATQANAAALKRYHGKIADKTVLENEEGKWQYAVMVRSGTTLREVMVNANTGKIDSVEVTAEAKERAEKQADEAKAKQSKAQSGKKPQ